MAPVRALFLRRPEAVLRLFHTAERRPVAGPLCAQLARARRPYREVPAAELARVAGTPHHGGIVAVALARRAVPLPGPDLPSGVAGTVLVLDGIGNPHNLGAIARSAAFFGCGALVLSDDPRQADLSDAAFRTAEGGLEQLDVWRAAGLTALLRGLRGRFLTVAAVAVGGVAPEAIPRDRDRPLALVLGNEEQGLPAATLAACEARVTLPGSGRVESLNVAAAAAVLLHALGRVAGKVAAGRKVHPARQ